jgi:hypothetical protein
MCQEPDFWPKVGFIPYYMIFMDFFNSFGRFSPFWGDIGPFLRPDIGEKLGGCYPLLVYINQRFLKP